MSWLCDATEPTRTTTRCRNAPPDPSVHITKSYPDKNQYHQGHRDILETSDTTSIGTITSTFTHQDIEQ
eukprot:scaffold133881_cov49-Attheya_sp.AAC.1